MARTQRRTFVDGPITFDPVVSRRRKVRTLPATLTSDDNDSLLLFTTAAGQLYTLPACEQGLHFHVSVKVTCTSGVHRVACATGDFFVGTVLQASDGTFTQVAVTANGTLVLEGAKDIAVNSEKQTITLHGSVRPIDLTPSNTVRSDQIAGLTIHVNGKGVVGDAIKRPFFLYRLLLGLLPF